VVLGFDRQGWITVFAALLLALITLFTNYTRLPITPMSTYWEPLPSTYRSKQEFLASLPPWRRLLQKLNWHPTIDVDVERYAIEQRLKRLEKEDERLDELSSKLSAILSSSGTSSTPPNATQGESEM
jgi:hypothetical protein